MILCVGMGANAEITPWSAAAGRSRFVEQVLALERYRTPSSTTTGIASDRSMTTSIRLASGVVAAAGSGSLGGKGVRNPTATLPHLETCFQRLLEATGVTGGIFETAEVVDLRVSPLLLMTIPISRSCS